MLSPTASPDYQPLLQTVGSTPAACTSTNSSSISTPGNPTPMNRTMQNDERVLVASPQSRHYGGKRMRLLPRLPRRIMVLTAAVAITVAGTVMFAGAAAAVPISNSVTRTASIWNCPTGVAACSAEQTRSVTSGRLTR
jgi:hypothetical protein